ncbi:MAG: hypothetical protein M3R65_11765 [Gemmatimonadota bacterium]|nr:hypothetical protein [Gemmatimonadota bacterium]
MRMPTSVSRGAPSSIDLGLPGADLIRKGICDIKAGESTAEALLVRIGATRLHALGVDIPEGTQDAPYSRGPEMALYSLLATADADSAHSRYNALVRTLVSFERAAESAAL